jgi:hypothetical protein
MTTLLFDEHASETNNNFHSGLNVTVRRGLKYAHTLEINEEVDMRNLAGEPLGKAKVQCMYVGPIEYIPESFLKDEHDPKCSKIGGLIEVLQNCYDDPTIDFTEVVTAIVLNIT